jgi:DNA-binding XRE family transcriptional regulator
MASEPVSIEDIAARLAQLRESFPEMNQAAFASYLGMTAQAWNNYERGLRRPDLATALKICQRVPGLTLDWIYRGEEGGLSARLLRQLSVGSTGQQSEVQPVSAPAPSRRG